MCFGHWWITDICNILICSWTNSVDYFRLIWWKEGLLHKLAGFNAEDGVNYATIPGSRTPDIINASSTSTAGVSGVWIFQISEETIVSPSNADSNGKDLPRCQITWYRVEENCYAYAIIIILKCFAGWKQCLFGFKNHIMLKMWV